MKKYFKLIVCFASLIPISTLACDFFAGTVKTGSVEHVFCDKKNQVLYGYDIARKEPSWATYSVNNRPIKTKIINRGVYPQIPDLETSLQISPDDFVAANMDKAFLIPPYNIVRNAALQYTAFGMQNILSIDSVVWRGSLRPTLFEIDLLERNMKGKIGGVQAIYGLVSGKDPQNPSELASPKYLYRVYIQNENQLSIAFLIPVKLNLSNDPSKYITSINCIEKVAGVDILANLPAKIQDDIENKAAWNKKIWARKDGDMVETKCDIQ